MNLLPTLNWNNESPKQLDIIERSDELSFSRFDIYAPLVRKVTVALTSGWQPFFTIAAHHPPLPNLRELVLDPTSDQNWQVEAVNICACAFAFLCPSLTKVCGLSHYPLCLEPLLASFLLKTTADIAKDLEALQIFIEEQEDVSYTKSLMFADIARFHNLHSLECSDSMMDSAVLRLLGTLPLLRSLGIEASANFDGDHENQDLFMDDLALPPHSFPLLRHLSLQYLPCSVIPRLWRYPPLVEQLVSVCVTLQFGLNNPLINDMVRGICKGSPHVVELYLDLNDIEDDDFSLTITDCLRQLPLQRFQLLNVRLPQLFSDMQPLVPAVANVQYLDIQNVVTTFDHLILFAKCLPQVQLLASNLILSGWPSNPQPGLITPSPSILCLEARFMFSEEFDEEDLDPGQTMEEYLGIVARNLHRLWPNGVTCGIY
ncbi:hypothetical protein FRC08_012691 [Ceratobasidium sp. 394]|nr:hypothetical protein FRC08_012691 [Ceratobasidium sp. 394]